MRLVLLFAAALVAGSATAADGLLPKKKPPVQDFLPVDQAFELQPLERKGGKLWVSFRIAKDYYLYRDRLKLSVGTVAVTPELPAALEHRDEHFGTTWIYRDRVAVAIPASPAKGLLTIGYQGCADAGLCYPPQTRSLEFP